MKASYIIIVLIVALAAIGGVVYWLSLPQPVDELSLRIYSDPMTENLLLAIENGNYTEFSRDFDDAMKNALNLASFQELRSKFDSKIGNYVPGSKAFIKGERTGEFIIAYYRANYTNEPAGVTVKVVFTSVNGPAKITGLWFSSPKLAS
ncbi:MAG: DUF3887 domain-containing protein [Candidatus Methanosuratincola sp.]|jgi:hypothetical protein|nr:DUF3887 domain-containing protein [Candidatus Methanosuratincola sp.]